MSQWTKILTAAEIDARFAFTAKLDPAFSTAERSFYEGRTARELRALKAGAWEANQADAYQMANSYLALAERSAWVTDPTSGGLIDINVLTGEERA